MFLVLDVIWYVVFLLSTTCHEAAHALVAELGGDLTAVHAGPVSLDPIPQVRRVPFGMIAAANFTGRRGVNGRHLYLLVPAVLARIFLHEQITPVHCPGFLPPVAAGLLSPV